MMEWLASLGYTYKGMCGCKSNKEVYDNGTGWQIWVTKGRDRMEIRQILDRDTTLRGIANSTNYAEVYQYTLNKYTHESN